MKLTSHCGSYSILVLKVAVLSPAFTIKIKNASTYYSIFYKSQDLPHLLITAPGDPEEFSEVKTPL